LYIYNILSIPILIYFLLLIKKYIKIKGRLKDFDDEFLKENFYIIKTISTSFILSSILEKQVRK